MHPLERSVVDIAAHRLAHNEETPLCIPSGAAKSLTSTPSLGATRTPPMKANRPRAATRNSLFQPRREESFPEQANMPALIRGVPDVDALDGGRRRQKRSSFRPWRRKKTFPKTPLAG